MDELKPPPIPDSELLALYREWREVPEENVGHLVRRGIAARDQQWLALVAELKRDAERLRTLYLAVQSDGFGWWTPDWCIKEGETAPTFDQFRSQIDTERAAIDAARGEKGGV